ncbi:MAG: hypothetical protein IT395_02305 [Candidatus Omnitrophica bacterium]|nr:hypothetical protein [Candidatus Omnitrophota bacterium]
MKVTQRLLVIFFLLFFLFLVGLGLYSRMGNAQLQKIQQNEVQSHQVSFEKILTLNRQAIFVLAKDYSYWDELVSAIKNEDVEWAAFNIDSGIKTYEADAAWVFNMDFKRVYSVNRFSDERLKDLPLTKEQVTQIFNGQSLVHFYLETPAGYLEVQGATVHPSNDSDRKTRAQGYFFVGKLWNNEYLKILSQLADCDVSVVPAQDAVKFLGRKDAFVIQVDDWGRSPLLAIVAAVDSVAIEHFHARSKVLLKLFVVYSALQMLCLLYFLRKFLRKI